MLTSDVSLSRDPSYAKLVHAWAADAAGFNEAFKHAWYKLTTRDMGPATRCAGADTPPPQPFQFPLPPPPPPPSLAPTAEVRAAVQPATVCISSRVSNRMQGSCNRMCQVRAAVAAAVAAAAAAGQAEAAALLPALAWQCASTFRLTDYLGGCNGARIRFAPQRAWPANEGLVDAGLAYATEYSNPRPTHP